MKNTECPCSRKGCKRHSSCEACEEYHLKIHLPTACETLRKKKRISEKSGGEGEIVPETGGLSGQLDKREFL